MGLDLTPQDYLEMLKKEHQEYQEDYAKDCKVSMRKAINCCGLSNALPEIIFAHYSATEPRKVHNKENKSAYRRYLRDQCEAHHTVRDICDYSKHGPKLTFRWGIDEPTVQAVQSIKQQTAGSPVGLLLAITHAHDVEQRVVRRKEHPPRPMGDVLQEVIDSWDAIFAQDKL